MSHYAQQYDLEVQRSKVRKPHIMKMFGTWICYQERDKKFGAGVTPKDAYNYWKNDHEYR